MGTNSFTRWSPASTFENVAQPVRHVFALTVAQFQSPDDFLSQPVTEFRWPPILCRDTSMPIGVAEWQTKLVQSLPEPLRSNLPTIEQIEEELGTSSDRMARGAT